MKFLGYFLVIALSLIFERSKISLACDIECFHQRKCVCSSALWSVLWRWYYASALPVTGETLQFLSDRWIITIFWLAGLGEELQFLVAPMVKMKIDFASEGCRFPCERLHMRLLPLPPTCAMHPWASLGYFSTKFKSKLFVFKYFKDNKGFFAQIFDFQEKIYGPFCTISIQYQVHMYVIFKFQGVFAPVPLLLTRIYASTS